MELELLNNEKEFLKKVRIFRNKYDISLPLGTDLLEDIDLEDKGEVYQSLASKLRAELLMEMWVSKDLPSLCEIFENFINNNLVDVYDPPVFNNKPDTIKKVANSVSMYNGFNYSKNELSLLIDHPLYNKKEPFAAFLFDINDGGFYEDEDIVHAIITFKSLNSVRESDEVKDKFIAYSDTNLLSCGQDLYTYKQLSRAFSRFPKIKSIIDKYIILMSYYD